MRSRVSMQDIADKLNISKNSVSQALTGKDGVSEKTRKLIVSTAKQMGYVHPASRGKQSQGRSPRIGLIASDFAFAQSFFGEIYLTIEQECSKYGLQLIIQSINQETLERLSLPQFLSNQSVDGVLVLSHLSTDYINRVIATGIPAVLIDHHDPRIVADCVLTNNRFGAFDGVRHLIDLGHREIGFIGNISFSPSYRERLEGYRMALDVYGIPADHRSIVENAVEESGYVSRYLSGIPKMPTAWFCANDGLGFLMTSSLQQLGYKIPKDISVCSFDNGRLSRISIPSTTTIAVDLKLFGRKAVEQLLWRIVNKDEPHVEVLLPTSLVVRDSTGSPETVG